MEALLGLALGAALSQGVSDCKLESPRHPDAATSLENEDAVPKYGTRYWGFHVAGGQSIVEFLGTSDRRDCGMAGLQYYREWPRLRYKHYLAHMMQEIYYEHSQGANSSFFTRSPSEAIGYLIGPRYNFGLRNGYGWYLGFGLGIQYQTRRTVDLPSRLNSTPFIDFGLWIPAGKNPVSVGLRYLHTSNGGTVGNNPGSNQVFFDVGFRF